MRGKKLQDLNPEIYLTGSYIVADFETTTLQYGSALNPNNELVLACWYDSRDGMYRHTWGSEHDQQELVKAIGEVDFLVSQNQKFEMAWLDRCGMDLHDLLGYDTMLGEWVILGNRKLPKDLGSLAARRGIKGKVDSVSWLIKIGMCPRDIPRAWLQEYCYEDVRTTLEVFLRQRVELRDRDQLHLQLSRCLLTPVLVDMEINGVTLDPQRVTEEYEKVQAEYIRTEEALREYGELNWRSRQQVAELLYDTLGFEELTDRRGEPIRTKSGQRGTTKETIASLRGTTAKQRKFLELFKAQANLQAKLSKTLEFFKGVCEEYDCSFKGSYNQGVTSTHRLSSSGHKLTFSSGEAMGIQLQNMPREYKRLVTAKNPGWLIVEADQAQLEFRGAAALTADPVALKEIIDQVDIHSITAQFYIDEGSDKEFKGKTLKEARQAAKPKCVPMYSEILTKRGWKTYDQLEIGEDVCSYNQDKEVLEWTPCLEKVKYESVPTYSLGFGGNWKTVSTGDHRWYGWKRTDHGTYRSYDKKVFTTNEIHTEHRIAVSAPLEATGWNKCSTSDAAVVAWLVTDGYLKISDLTGSTSQGIDGRRRGVAAVIIQKKAKGIDHIKASLKGSNMRYHQGTKEDSGVYRFYLRAEEVRQLFSRAGLDLTAVNSQLTNWVLSLSKEARTSFLETCILAEGTHHGGGVFKISQNVGPVKEAIHLAAYLNGHDVRVSITPKEKVKLADYDHATLRLRNKGSINGTKLVRTEDLTQDVWCPRTSNGSWVMRQGETVTITGNTFRPTFGGTGITKADRGYSEFFKAKYNVMYKAQYAWALEVLRNGKLRTPYGMEFYWDNVKMSPYGKVDNQTAIFNYPIQGISTGEIVPISLIALWHRLRGRKVKIVLTVHDSVVLEVSPDEDMEFIKDQIVQAFTNDVFDVLESLYGFRMTVPLGCEICVGTHWSEGVKTKYQMDLSKSS